MKLHRKKVVKSVVSQHRSAFAIVEHHAVFATESPIGHLTQTVGRDGTIVVHLAVDVVGLPRQFEPGEIGGYVQVIHITKYLGSLKLVFHLLQFRLVYQLPTEQFQFGTDGGLGFVEGNTRRGLAADVEQAGIAAAGM